jgi:hypothetical protein
MHIEGYTDSDFAPDYGTYADNYRSTSGHHFDYNNTPVHWATHRQSLFAQSCYEAETYAAVDAAKEAVHLHRLLHSMGDGDGTPIHLHGDNKPSTTNMHNFADTSRSKALDRQAHYLRHLVHSGEIIYSYTPGPENRADGLTKSLPAPAQDRPRNNWRVQSGCCDPEHTRRRVVFTTKATRTYSGRLFSPHGGVTGYERH